jgi:hypothetical protein
VKTQEEFDKLVMTPRKEDADNNSQGGKGSPSSTKGSPTPKASPKPQVGVVGATFDTFCRNGLECTARLEGKCTKVHDPDALLHIERGTIVARGINPAEPGAKKRQGSPLPIGRK